MRASRAVGQRGVAMGCSDGAKVQQWSGQILWRRSSGRRCGSERLGPLQAERRQGLTTAPPATGTQPCEAGTTTTHQFHSLAASGPRCRGPTTVGGMARRHQVRCRGATTGRATIGAGRKKKSMAIDVSRAWQWPLYSCTTPPAAGGARAGRR